MIWDVLQKLWPLLVLQLGLQVIALINLKKREKVRFDNKWIWVLIIVFGNILGPVAYFIFRGDESDDGSSED